MSVIVALRLWRDCFQTPGFPTSLFQSPASQAAKHVRACSVVPILTRRHRRCLLRPYTSTHLAFTSCHQIVPPASRWSFTVLTLHLSGSRQPFRLPCSFFFSPTILAQYERIRSNVASRDYRRPLLWVLTSSMHSLVTSRSGHWFGPYTPCHSATHHITIGAEIILINHRRSGR